MGFPPIPPSGSAGAIKFDQANTGGDLTVTTTDDMIFTAADILRIRATGLSPLELIAAASMDLTAGDDIVVTTTGGRVIVNANDDIDLDSSDVLSLAGDTSVDIALTGGETANIGSPGAALGFFGATPVGQPSGVATLPDVISALQDLGLIS